MPFDMEQIRLATQEYIQDTDYWTAVLNNELNPVIASLHGKMGLSEEVKGLVTIYYKIKIHVMEKGVRLIEREKNLTLETSCHPDLVEKIANLQLNIETAKEELLNFVLKGELP